MFYVKIIHDGKLKYLIKSLDGRTQKLTELKSEECSFSSRESAETYISKFTNKGSMLIVEEPF